ncbi:UNKNOWN [Stylonychia lemnae]|uniref:Uncharacterized protein n=1 Tax=Stylonychia lemnae TaxID=5949 RepID=A0A078A4I7_STYLE|nr:UNKNOWN [Stylonychia lemnae]|eukprot:CDW76408.1 UNKNOWN [Stylonychia lemnae]
MCCMANKRKSRVLPQVDRKSVFINNKMISKTLTTQFMQENEYVQEQESINILRTLRLKQKDTIQLENLSFQTSNKLIIENNQQQASNLSNNKDVIRFEQIEGKNKQKYRIRSNTWTFKNDQVSYESSPHQQTDQEDANFEDNSQSFKSSFRKQYSSHRSHNPIRNGDASFNSSIQSYTDSQNSSIQNESSSLIIQKFELEGAQDLINLGKNQSNIDEQDETSLLSLEIISNLNTDDFSVNDSFEREQRSHKYQSMNTVINRYSNIIANLYQENGKKYSHQTDFLSQKLIDLTLSHFQNMDKQKRNTKRLEDQIKSINIVKHNKTNDEIEHCKMNFGPKINTNQGELMAIKVKQRREDIVQSPIQRKLLVHQNLNY